MMVVVVIPLVLNEILAVFAGRIPLLLAILAGLIPVLLPVFACFITVATISVTVTGLLPGLLPWCLACRLTACRS
jgi:hypothetical protein